MTDRLLDRYMRPLVEFNASDRLHRQYYYQFLKDNGWGKLPVRFKSHGTFAITKGVIDRQLLEYFLQDEFSHDIGPLAQSVEQ